MITIFGAPGSGKTVQGQLLARKYGWTWVSYRDLLLSLGDREITKALEYGLYVDWDKATRMMGNTFQRLRRSNTRGVVLDGFPADYRQVRWMIDNGEIADITGAIVLRVPRGELWKRLVERKRVDDTRAAIERRQESYERSVTGMIRALSENGAKIRDVDGRNTPADVLDRIEEVLGEWGLIERKQFEKMPRM
jgi:adenylate kinase